MHPPPAGCSACKGGRARKDKGRLPAAHDYSSDLHTPPGLTRLSLSDRCKMRPRHARLLDRLHMYTVGRTSTLGRTHDDKRGLAPPIGQHTATLVRLAPMDSRILTITCKREGRT